MAYFRCPVCGKELKREEKQCRCGQGHCFDVAKQNYVNLLISQKSLHGDDKGMVAARHRFLQKGYYSHLKEALCREIAKRNVSVLLDAGCGEGYYTNGMSEALPQADILAVDISKEAVAKGKSDSPRIHRAVASCFDLPIQSQSVDVITSLFAPVAADEFDRVLKEDGALFVVVPDTMHLYELKKAVYERPRENDAVEFADDRFILEERIPVEKRINVVGNEDIRALFSMTPYCYRTGETDKARLNALQELNVLTQFKILKYSKKAPR